MEAGPLLPVEAEWLEEMLASVHVAVADRDLTSPDGDEYFPRIIIKNSTVEVPDDNGGLVHVKFTWRYTENHPYQQLSASPKIFRSQFNLIYD